MNAFGLSALNKTSGSLNLTKPVAFTVANWLMDVEDFDDAKYQRMQKLAV